MAAMNRRFRALTVLAAVVSLLFMQIALAAFACPGSLQASASGVQAADGGCEKDMSSPLCRSHCGQSAQALEKPPVPAIPPAALVGFIAARDLFAECGAAQRSAPRRTRTHLPPEPDLALRNCCLRI